MTFMNKIIEWLNNAAEYFYDLYLECYYRGFPLNTIDYFFYYLSVVFERLARYFSDLLSWLLTIANEVANILNWSTIWSYILSYVPNLEEIRDWFYSWWSNVTDVVTTWWSSTSTTVLGWIDEAKQWTELWLDYLGNQVTALGVRIDDVLALIPNITEIQAWFTNWTGNVTSVINTWWNTTLIDVESLINSAFTEREPFWDGWQDWKDKVAEFFVGPLDWLESKFSDWFLGAE